MPNNEQSAPRRKPPRVSPAIKNAESSPSSPAPVVPAATPTPQPEVKPQELPAYEFLGYLPESYGTKKLFLVARDPHILFAYWDLNQVQYQEAARAAHDGKVFLEVYVPGEGRVQQIHIWDCHKNWYLQVNRPETAFVAQLGYYRADGSFEVLARSAEVRTPRDTLSPNTDARFVTIPVPCFVPRTLRHDRRAGATRRGTGGNAGPLAAQRFRTALPGPRSARSHRKGKRGTARVSRRRGSPPPHGRLLRNHRNPAKSGSRRCSPPANGSPAPGRG